MDGYYQYQKSLCNCPDSSVTPGTAGAYDYMDSICVCAPGLILLDMRDLLGNETTSYPVNAYNVNEDFIDLATTKSQYRNVWNSDPVNQAIGTLGNGPGPFQFYLELNPGQTAPAYVIGDPVGGGGPGTDTGIYAQQYAEEYE